MEFEKAKKAVQRVLDQYAGDDDVKAATVVAAALNAAYFAKGHVFMVNIGESVSSLSLEKDFSDLRSKIFGVQCSRK